MIYQDIWKNNCTFSDARAWALNPHLGRSADAEVTENPAQVLGNSLKRLHKQFPILKKKETLRSPWTHI